MNLPQENGYTIYTKQECLNCNKAKKLLDNDEVTYTTINCDDLLLKNRVGFINMMSSYTNQKTFPYVFYNGVFIGGYNELLHHLTFQDM
jgi:glutaredoxin